MKCKFFSNRFIALCALFVSVFAVTSCSSAEDGTPTLPAMYQSGSVPVSSYYNMGIHYNKITAMKYDAYGSISEVVIDSLHKFKFRYIIDKKNHTYQLEGWTDHRGRSWTASIDTLVANGGMKIKYNLALATDGQDEIYAIGDVNNGNITEIGSSITDTAGVLRISKTLFSYDRDRDILSALSTYGLSVTEETKCSYITAYNSPFENIPLQNYKYYFNRPDGRNSCYYPVLIATGCALYSKPLKTLEFGEKGKPAKTRSFEYNYNYNNFPIEVINPTNQKSNKIYYIE